MSALRRALLCIVVLSMWVPDGLAAQDRARGRVLFEEATAAREEGRWADVRTLLEQSLGVYATFSTAWNLVTALEQLDDLAAAETQLLRIRDGEYGALDEDRTRAVTERLARVTGELGTIVVEVGVRDVVVRLDGVERERTDTSGRSTFRAAAGSHVVVIASDEGQAAERELDLERGETRTIRFTLASRIEPASLVVDASDPSRTVRVVGVADAVAHLELTLAPAEYRVVLVGGGADRTILLAPGRHEHVVLTRAEELWESPWLWVVLGAAVLAGAGTATGVYVGTNQIQPPIGADFAAPPL